MACTGITMGSFEMSFIFYFHALKRLARPYCTSFPHAHLSTSDRLLYKKKEKKTKTTAITSCSYLLMGKESLFRWESLSSTIHTNSCVRLLLHGQVLSCQDQFHPHSQGHRRLLGPCGQAFALQRLRFPQSHASHSPYAAVAKECALVGSPPEPTQAGSGCAGFQRDWESSLMRRIGRQPKSRDGHYLWRLEHHSQFLAHAPWQRSNQPRDRR